MMKMLNKAVAYQRASLNIPADYYCDPHYHLVQYKEDDTIDLGITLNCQESQPHYHYSPVGDLMGYDVDYIDDDVTLHTHYVVDYEQYQTSLDFKLEAQKLFSQGDCQEALTHISWAMTLNPEGNWLHFDRGVYYLGCGDYMKAIYDFTTEIKKNIVENNPDHSIMRERSYYERAIAYKRLGQTQKAKEDYEMVAMSSNEELSEISKRLFTHYELENIFESHHDHPANKRTMYDLAQKPSSYVQQVDHVKKVQEESQQLES